MRQIRLLLIAALALFGALTVHEGLAGAANGYEQWAGPFSDGCTYYWDGYAYTVAACDRTDQGYDFYTPDGWGGWSYSMSAGWLADGRVWVTYDGVTYIAVTQLSYSSSAVIQQSSWAVLSGNLIVSQIMIETSTTITTSIFTPTCLEMVGYTCYY